jgi:Tfp pilus assembly protein PilN
VSQQINLYSAAFRKQKKPFTAVAMLQSMAGVLAVLAVFYGVAYYQARAVERDAGTLGHRVAAALEQLKKGGIPVTATDEKALDARIAEIEARALANEQLLARTAQTAERAAYIEPLRVLARQRLEGVWLTTIQLEGDAGELSLAGRALHAGLVARYVERLGKDPAMRGRNFSALQIDSRKANDSKAGAPSAEVEFRLMATDPGGG